MENVEKTTAVSTGDSDLSDVIDYAIQQHKTSQSQARDGEEVVQRFVSGINCNPRTAKIEMQKIKKFYGKEDGVIAYHGYQSFAPGEATPEIAHEIGVKLAQRLWGDRYQVLVATHLDRANHLHSHFVINTVSFVDGIKYHRTKQDYKEMQRASDALCKEYGLSVIRNPKGRGKTYSEWAAEKDGKPTLRSVIRSDIDRAILASTTQRNFQEAMLRSGKELKVFAVKDGDLQKFCEEAKKYGVLYCVLKDKNATDGITDIMVRAEDAAKVNRIFTRFGLATVDLASLKTELVRQQDKTRTEEDADVRSGSDKPHNDDFVKELFGEDPEKHIVEENPQTGRNEAERPSESTLPNRRGEEIFSDSRPSVREAMKQIRQEKAARQPQNTIADKVVEKITKGKER